MLSLTMQEPKILIHVEGGLGDQASAEASIRYLKEKVFPYAEIHISCRVPRIFWHLGLTTHLHKNLSETLPDWHTFRQLETFQSRGKLTESLCFFLSHTSNYHAASLLFRQLPLLDRGIQLGVYEEDRKNLQTILGSRYPKKLVVIHAGKGWKSKTFPLPWWQKVSDLLSDSEIPVALIGQAHGGGEDDLTSFVPIEARGNVIDLRNKLSLGELFALLESAPILISNDSGPVQLAGAFNNWIVLIPSCIHPDFMLPYRNGSPYFKAKALHKKLLADDQKWEPVRGDHIIPNYEVPDWSPYLPDPETVLEAVTSILAQE